MPNAPDAPTPPSATAEPITVNEASDAERANYLQVAVATIGAIEDAIALLVVRQAAPDLGGDERRRITVELADLEARKARVRAEMHAFIAGRQAVRPPDTEALAKVKDLAEKLDDMTAGSVMTGAIVDAVSDLLALYNETRS
ncbi:hypothetical protein [Haliangium sp.]|uniref:hypothetical protein n=1 Tax=Haliangium sp. TaxID=2663208 RepID=UPI003D103119